MHDYQKNSVFVGRILYFKEWEPEVVTRAKDLRRVGELPTGAVVGAIRITLEEWNRLKGKMRGAIFEEMRVVHTMKQATLF